MTSTTQARKLPEFQIGRLAGVAAYEAGIVGAPAYDPSTANVLAGFSGIGDPRNIAWMSGWQDGWTAEMLAAPVPGIDA
jgi:hypothetical protein